MRDIKPTGKMKKPPHHKAPEGLEPEASKLYAKQAKRASASHKRFAESKVSVTNVQVPKPDEVTMERRPLFATVDTSKKKHSKKKRSSMHLGRKERTILLSLLGVVGLMVAIALFIFLPKAAISLIVKTDPLLIDQKLTIATDPASAPNSVPGSVFNQTVDVQGSSPVTSTEKVGTKAKGTVQLINKTFDEQKIKEKSRLVTKDGILFYMVGSATIPAASSGGVASTEVQVEAAEAGPQGNIAAQRLDFAALDAGGQQVVYGQSVGTFSGGTGDEVKVVQDADLEQAKAAAQAQAKAQVEQAAKSQLQKGWSLLDESWDAKLTTFTPTGKVGDHIDAITYTANATVRVIAFQEDTLMKSLEGALQAALSKDYMLFPGPISYTKAVDETNWDTGQVAITARVTHTTIPTFSIATLKDKLAGRSKEEAINYLQGLPGVQSAKIDLSPFWVQGIPEIQSRIDIKLSSDRDI